MVPTLLLLVACDGSGPVPAVPLPTVPVPTNPDPFLAALAEAGFGAIEGRAGELDPADCCAWESCYLFNPDNDYMGWWLPRGPGQLAPNPAEQADGTAVAWRLRADEAVVAIGRTPPSAAYFSYRSYLHDRWIREKGLREWVFFNLGDSLNQFVVGTDTGGPFDAPFALITTADAATDAAVRAALVAAGLPNSAINTDVIAGDDLVLGLHPEADTFRVQGRMALFADPVAGRTYIDSPDIRVFRVAPLVEQPHVPLTPAPLRSRGTGTNEAAWSEAFEALDVAVRSAHADYRATTLPTIVPTSDEDECPPGCNRDTFFGVTIHYVLPPTADAFVLVYGVNHERTGKSVYSNFSVIETEHLSSYAAVHSGNMPGSAAVYVPGHPQVDDLYAYKIARHCGLDPYCIAVPTACPGIPAQGQGSIAFRAYTEAATATGPLTSELLVDRAILFTRPPQATP